MKIIKEQILKELTTLDMCQGGVRHSSDELVVIADRWFEVINTQFISKDVFHDAVIMFQVTNSWFPTVHEILDNVKSVWENRRRNIKALPGPDFIPPTKEEMAENKKRLSKIFKKIGKPIKSKRKTRAELDGEIRQILDEKT